jgi:chemotaxis protein MotB
MNGDKGYSNWELSADRANASRRELIAGGMEERKVLRVVGLGSAAHLDKVDPFSPINRRISIIVMNKRTEESIMRDNAMLEVGTKPETAQATPPADTAALARK